MLPRLALPRTYRVLGRRLGLAALACLLVATSAAGSSASISSRLSAAKRELTTLTGRIQSEEAQARSLQDQVSGLGNLIASAMSRAEQIQGELTYTRGSIRNATAKVAALQARIDAVAQTLFMQGGGNAQLLDSLLSSTSLTDFSDRLAYASVIGQSSVDLANHVEDVKVGLAVQAAQLSTLREEQTRLLSQLGDARATKAQALDQQRAAVDQLASTKGQIVTLIVKLHKQLKAQELAAVGTAFQGSGHVTYGAWAGLFLRTMGVSGCHRNMIAVVAWQYSEFTQAAWNPLATTVPMPGSTVYNSSNVQNYPSLEEGLQATKTTIDQGSSSFGYGTIVSALSRCSDPMTTASAVNASSWCSGCAAGTYVTGNIPRVEADYTTYAKL